MNPEIATLGRRIVAYHHLMLIVCMALSIVQGYMLRGHIVYTDLMVAANSTAIPEPTSIPAMADSVFFYGTLFCTLCYTSITTYFLCGSTERLYHKMECFARLTWRVYLAQVSIKTLVLIRATHNPHTLACMGLAVVCELLAVLLNNHGLILKRAMQEVWPPRAVAN